MHAFECAHYECFECAYVCEYVYEGVSDVCDVCICVNACICECVHLCVSVHDVCNVYVDACVYMCLCLCM